MREIEIGLIVLFAAWISSVCLFFYLIIKTLKAKKWIKHEGIIKVSDVQCMLHHNPGYKEYKSIVRYEYIVDSILYTSKCVFFGDFLWVSFPFTTRRIKKKYKVHDKVIIYYNPKKTQQAVLEPGFHFVVFLTFLSILMLLVLILLFYNQVI